MDTYNGHVRTPADAIKLFEACRLGLLPRVQRRLSEKERQSIKSGSVFVWDEREAGMRRWTDGKSWSASRVSGSFLTYREMEGKRGGGQFASAPSRRSQGKTPESGRGSDDDKDMDADGPDGYRYKPDGLMKQSFSITTSTGQHLHLISYFSRPQANSPELPQPTTDPALRHIVPAKGMYPESTVHESTTPAVTRTPMQPGPYMPAPHMQGGRGAPYPPYPGHNGYWPPSPAPTPPYYNAQWAPSGPPPPHYQPGSAHTSPYQHHQTSPQQRPSSSGQPTTYDRPPQDASLAPPAPRGMSSATAAQYARSPSPRMAQAQLLADQSAQIARRALQSSPKFEAHLTNSPPRSNILPMPPMSGPARTSTPPQQTATADDTPQSNGRVSPAGTPKLNGNSQNIPSISSLVHAQDSVSVMSDNKSNSSRAGSRAGSRSPKDEQRPKDIPHDKLNIMGEDRRAIQVLDRKFNF